MRRREQARLRAFLKPSEFCDCNNREVYRLARKLTRDASDPREAAIRIFFFVRDKIKFGYPHLGKASDVLSRGYGTCSSKTNLQVALLRSIGIPARFRLQSINARVLFEDKVPPPFREEEFSGEVTHYSAEVYLDGKWLVADTTFDEELDPEKAIDWDGETHAMILSKKEILRELGVKENLDYMFESRRKEMESQSKQDADIRRLYVGILNTYFELIRLRNLVQVKRS